MGRCVANGQSYPVLAARRHDRSHGLEPAPIASSWFISPTRCLFFRDIYFLTFSAYQTPKNSSLGR
jgi:hypothetical protein